LPGGRAVLAALVCGLIYVTIGRIRLPFRQTDFPHHIFIADAFLHGNCTRARNAGRETAGLPAAQPRACGSLAKDRGEDVSPELREGRSKPAGR